MEKLKVLFFTMDQSDQMEKSSHYLAEELKKQCDVMFWRTEGQMANILEQLPYKPDFILLNDCFAPKLGPLIKGLNDVHIPKAIIFHDISNYIHQRKRYIAQENIDMIFVHYRDAFRKWYPQLNRRMIWFPHHANLEIYKDYQLEKNINWLMMGALSSRLYPLRTLMLQRLKSTRGFQYHPHPGYYDEHSIQPGSLIGKDYAQEINRAKMFLTCNSVFEYPLMKYFEVLGCNTLLLAPSSKELTDLGFVDRDTFIAVNKNNFEEKAAYYLRNEDERIRIARNGYQMVREKHSTEKRATELIQHIKQIIKRKTQTEGR
ncbi:glycosyltransferase family 1 protein [Siminovitchia acidinfaciens]|uniref:Glycosyltransferase family 1 protein n=1 Tax=Siminovitchia acidinfaciens TaxID=2321395 RepID=A0A429Y4I8_9BACI|nr:glycosyltransferase [Siminovitchia acidinfaciens]RST76321.1 glycosyltransferase family 1 protein [Siminovitchia acidinfaciens]